MRRAFPRTRARLLRILYIDPVANDATQNPARGRTDNRSLELVTARGCAEHRAGRGTDGRVTLRVADRLPRLPRVRPRRSRRARNATRAPTRGRRRRIRRARHRLDLLRIAVRL